MKYHHGNQLDSPNASTRRIRHPTDIPQLTPAMSVPPPSQKNSQLSQNRRSRRRRRRRRRRRNNHYSQSSSQYTASSSSSRIRTTDQNGDGNSDIDLDAIMREQVQSETGVSNAPKTRVDGTPAIASRNSHQTLDDGLKIVNIMQILYLFIYLIYSS